MANHKEIVLGILPSLGGSIESQQRDGREGLFLNYYVRTYLKNFKRVSYFSYGDNASDIHIDNFQIHSNSCALHRYLYQFIIPFKYSRELKKCSLLRVMQTTGIIPAIIAKWFLGVPFVVTYGFDYSEFARIEGHSVKALFLRIILPFLLQFADGIIVTTEESRAQMVGWLKNSHGVRLVPNGMDPNLFTSVNLRTSTNLFRLLFVGRLEKQKNLFFLLDVIELLKEEGGEVELTVVGDGSLRRELEDYSGLRKLPVVFTGSVPYEQIKEYHAKANCFVMPSLTEGHPKALIEAMGSGLACIVSNCSGNNVLVEHNQTGILLELGDRQVWKDSILHLLNHPDEMVRLGRNAREKIVYQLDISKTLECEISLLKEISKV